MNVCFGGNYKHFFNDALKMVQDGCYVWFPKERKKDKLGKWKSGSSEVNWKNYISDDGLKLFQYLDEDEAAKDSCAYEPKLEPDVVPLYTFMKSEKYNNQYKYVGTFLRDNNVSTPKEQVYRRVSSEIDLDMWYNGYDLSDLGLDSDESPAYKNIYYKRNFQEQKKRIESFLLKKKKYDDLDSIRLKFSDEYSLPVIGKMDECVFKNTYIPALSNVISMCLNRTVSLEELYPENLEYEKIGMAYYLLIRSHYEDKSYKPVSDKNESILKPHIAAIIKAIYGDSESYIYSLQEPEVDKYLSNINMKIPQNADLLEKQCLLVFWKKCNIQMETWDMQTYVEFLKTLSD
jgi:hypothetical protein